ncbi:hypothetical protein CapIbe_019861 [Capra ibex]
MAESRHRGPIDGVRAGQGKPFYRGITRNTGGGFIQFSPIVSAPTQGRNAILIPFPEQVCISARSLPAAHQSPRRPRPGAPSALARPLLRSAPEAVALRRDPAHAPPRQHQLLSKEGPLEKTNKTVSTRDTKRREKGAPQPRCLCRTHNPCSR